MKPVIILGGGGHAKVLISILHRLNTAIIGIVDPNKLLGSEYLHLPVLGDDTAIFDFNNQEYELVNGIGSLPNDTGLRARLFQTFSSHHYVFKTLIDPSALVADEVELGQGVQVMAGAIIQTGAKIANNTIINSGAIVEHDTQIGQHVHIAPGAVVCGQVNIADGVHIGAGATVIQNIHIGCGSVIGAGCVLTQHLGSGQIVYPARPHFGNLQQVK